MVYAVMALRVNEIFYSLQGESLCAGRPCTFVRLTGCNLRCVYCDTRYAYEEGDLMEIEAILERVARHPAHLVELTGGEPLVQPETPELIRRFLDSGYEVLLETNGSFDISRVDPHCIRIVDIKCPSSGESEKTDLHNLNRLHPHDQVKFVIGDRDDYQFARNIAQSIPAGFPSDHLLLSPVAGHLSPRHLAEWMLADGFEARLHLQLHKIIWPEIERGV